jgi:hypothetical protein
MIETFQIFAGPHSSVNASGDAPLRPAVYLETHLSKT